MTREEIENKVNDILLDWRQIHRDDIKPDASLEDDFNFDDLDFVELVITIDNVFGIGLFVRAEYIKCNTVKDVYDIVEQELNT